MKIFNICNGCYTEGWGYQENMLPEYENKCGHKAFVFASSNHFPAYINEDEKEQIQKRGHDYVYNGVHVYRYNTYLHTPGVVFITTHLFRTLLKEKPDIIFQHGVHPCLLKSVLYKLFHRNCIIFVDSHTDYINHSKKVLWNFILRKCFLRLVCKISSPFIEKFYGVSPGRCEYLKEVYHLKEAKVDLLPIGFDSDAVRAIENNDFRKANNISDDSFVICMGGKLENSKGTGTLIKVVQQLKKKMPNLVLLLFGRVLDASTKDTILSDSSIKNVGWCNRMDTIRALKQSQIAIWPIHHTTLIEDAVSCATPIIVKGTGNTSHLVDNNGILLKEGTENELKDAIIEIYNNYSIYKKGALEIQEKYSYYRIVEQIVNDYNHA